jgi:hypothetical protein
MLGNSRQKKGKRMDTELLKKYEGEFTLALTDIAYESNEPFAKDIAAFALGIHPSQVADTDEDRNKAA